MSVLIGPAERIALALWAGMLWSLGYVVTPAAFRVLEEPELAGRVAAEVHQTGAWVGLACGVVLLIGQLRHRVRPLAAHWRLCLVVAMILMTLIGEFLLRPDPGAVEVIREGGEAGVWHAGHRVAETLYFITGVVALVLVLGGLAPGGSDGPAADQPSSSGRGR